MHYLFSLGHQPHISIAEIEAVLETQGTVFSIEKQTNTSLIISTDTLNPTALIETLGGSIVIAQKVADVGDKKRDIANTIEKLQPEGKIQFALEDNALALGIKKELKQRGRSVRYIEIKNTATILHNNLVEKQGHFTLINNELFVTRAIQPIEAFAERDYGRPGHDSKSGMLPPKLARMMINLSGVKPDKDTTLLDPFCGSGTILMEALLLGFPNIIGSDVSEKAVSDTKENIEWLERQSDNSITKQSSNQRIIKLSNYQIIHCDATKIDSRTMSSSVDLIVAEPYLGKPLKGNEQKTLLEKQAKELRDLYVNSFKAFQKILKKNAVVVFVIPTFRHTTTSISVDCVKEIKKLGFTPEPFGDKSSLLYHRPKQFIGREIWRFRNTL